MWLRSGGVDPGRDGCRVPIALVRATGRRTASAPTASTTWLDQPADWAALTVEAQTADPASMLALYRDGLRLRRSRPVGRSDDLRWLARARRRARVRARRALRLPRQLRPRAVSTARAAPTSCIASDELEGGALPQDTTVWLRQAETEHRPRQVKERKDDEVHSFRQQLRPPCGPAGRLRDRRRASASTTKTVTISVASLIPGSTPAAIQQFNNQVAQFEKANPSIKIKPVEYQWTGPTFAAKLAAGTLPTVFEVPFTDARTLGDNGQLADLTAEAKALPYFSKYNKAVLAEGTDCEGPDRRAAEGRLRAGAALQPKLFAAGRPRPEQAADDVGAAPGVRHADLRRRPARPATSRWRRTTTPPAGSSRRSSTRSAAGWRPGTGTNAVATLNNTQTVTALNMLKQMRWTDNSMGSNFDYGWSDINQAFAAGNVGMYISGSDVYTNLVQASNIDPSIYGLAPIPLAKNKNAGVLGGGTLVARQARRRTRRSARGGQVDRLLLRAAAGHEGAGDPEREDARREQAAGRRAGAADLQQEAVRPREHAGSSRTSTCRSDQMKPFTTGIFGQTLIPEPAASTQAVYHALDAAGRGGADGQERQHPVAAAAGERHAQTADLAAEVAQRHRGRPGRPAAHSPARPTWMITTESSAAKVDGRAPRESSHRVRRTPLTWVRGGGLATLLFLLPLLLVFGAFSWYPIVRTVVMAFQHTNLVQAPTWVGLDNFRAVIARPAAPDRRQEHGVLRAARAHLRLSDPARRGGADERGCGAPRLVQRARLPAGRHPARRRGPPLEDVLRRELDRRLQHGPRLGRPRAVPVAAVAVSGRCRRSCSRRRGRTRARR